MNFNDSKREEYMGGVRGRKWKVEMMWLYSNLKKQKWKARGIIFHLLPCSHFSKMRKEEVEQVDEFSPAEETACFPTVQYLQAYPLTNCIISVESHGFFAIHPKTSESFNGSVSFFFLFFCFVGYKAQQIPMFLKSQRIQTIESHG